MTKIINLFAGPGAGKSTLAAGMFYEMKKQGKSVELVTEYAKDVVWEENHIQLEDQLFVTANQNKRLWRLRGKVDYVINDSPLLLGIHYCRPSYFPNFYEKFVWELWDYYENLNFFINRGEGFMDIGRIHKHQESIEIDNAIKDMLNFHFVPFTEVDQSQSPLDILEQGNV